MALRRGATVAGEGRAWRLHRQPLAATPARRLGAADQRLLGLDRLARGAGADQSALYRHLRPAALAARPRLRQRGLPRRRTDRRAQLPRRAGRGAGRHHRRHRADLRRRRWQDRRGIRGRPRGRHRRRRADRLRRRRPLPLPGDQLLPGRPVQGLPLQALRRRAAGVLARTRRGLVRRRSGQLQLPALRPRLRVPAPLRGRQAGADSGVPGLGHRAAAGRRSGVRLRQSGQHGAAADGQSARHAARHLPAPAVGAGGRAARSADSA